MAPVTGVWPIPGARERVLRQLELVPRTDTGAPSLESQGVSA